MKSSEETKDIFAALSKLQAENKGAELEAVNPFFKSKYSTLKDAWDSIRESIGRNGLALLQDVTTKENAVSVTTIVSHLSGQWIEFGPLEVPFAKRDAQSVGSAVTYARRYALCATLGIVSGVEDDDGNEAMPKRETPEPRFITQDQMENLIAIIDDDDEYRETVLTFYKINSLAEIESTKYQAILKSALRKAENRKKTEGQNGL
jgi:hypothetical protein